MKNDSLKELLPEAKNKTKAYVDKHIAVAKKYAKPIVLEEFGYPRDNFSFIKNTPTTLRDEYYRYVFDLVHKAKNHNGLLAGCNFWAWGGFANHTLGHMFWEKGDDYMGDPVQEEQGLNSVFITDSTIKIISEANKQLKYD